MAVLYAAEVSQRLRRQILLKSKEAIRVTAEVSEEIYRDILDSALSQPEGAQSQGRLEVAIAIIANSDPASGVGEPATTVIAPAIANAIYNAVGARVRALPITAEAVKAAMKG